MNWTIPVTETLCLCGDWTVICRVVTGGVGGLKQFLCFCSERLSNFYRSGHGYYLVLATMNGHFHFLYYASKNYGFPFLKPSKLSIVIDSNFCDCLPIRYSTVNALFHPIFSYSWQAHYFLQHQLSVIYCMVWCPSVLDICKDKKGKNIIMTF